MIGSSLGHYEITDKLGEGGMGVVYRARDSRLERDVAVKVLPESVAGDPERLARFEREAKVLASLNHPHIAQIHGLEHDESGHALVMELVEGPTLADRLQGGALPLEEAVDIARQIAEGLEEAHEKGVVHRDLKPDNVKAPPQGAVKILDFGLAKALEPAKPTSDTQFAQAPTRALGDTTEGMILGTVGYMAPEQAKGLLVDKRCDIWAFGVVLWEMLTGRPLFGGDSVADALADVLRGDIDLGSLPDGTPPALRTLLGRCLERDPKLRLRDIGEARIALASLDQDAGETESGGPVSVSPGPWRVVAAVAGLVALGALAWALRPTTTPVIEEPAPRPIEFGFVPEEEWGMGVLSPDGRSFAIVAPGVIQVRDLDDRRALREIRDDRIDPRRQVIWAPNQRGFAFENDGELWRIEFDSSSPTLVGELPRVEGVPRASLLDATWLEDDRILLAMWRGGVYSVPARGGRPTLLIPIDPERQVDYHLVRPFAGGGLLLAQHVQEGVEESNLVVWRDGRVEQIEQSSAFRNPQLVGLDQESAVFLDANRRAWAVEFDAQALRFAGEPVALTEEGLTGAAYRNGVFVSVLGREWTGQIVRLDRSGSEIETFGPRMPEVSDPAISNDGKRVAFAVERRQIWVEDLERGTTVMVHEDDRRISRLRFGPAGDYLYFSGEQAWGSDDLRRVRAVAGSEVEILIPEVGSAELAPSGDLVVFSESSFQQLGEAALMWSELDASGELGEPEVLVRGFNAFGRPSPDRRLFVYTEDLGPRYEVFVATFPEAEGAIQISGAGGWRPQWSADSRSVYYRTRESLVEVEVGFDQTGSPRASAERVLFRLAEAPDQNRDWTWGPHWAVDPRGGFLFVRERESDQPLEIVFLVDGVRATLDGLR